MRDCRGADVAAPAVFDGHGNSQGHAQVADLAGPREAPDLGDLEENNIRCVRIIHGKGYGSNNKGPIIKPLVNKWLQQRNEILAFCSARPIDGGTGAVYVLLKSLR